MFDERALFFRVLSVFSLCYLLVGLMFSIIPLQMIGLACTFAVEVSGYGTLKMLWDKARE